MSNSSNRKNKLIHELKEYLLNFAYLALFFGVFMTYRRLLLAGYDISYADYGVSIIKALILAKVIMIGDMLKLGRGLADKPLIYPTLYKTVVFTLWVLLFHLLEETVRGLLHGQGLAGGVFELIKQLPYELPAHLLIIFFVFLPFFGIRELSNVVGEGIIRQLFFTSRSALSDSDKKK